MNKKVKKSKLTFAQLSQYLSDAVGSIWSFIVALLFVVIWLIIGPFFNYSDTWQLIINTSTTVITFLIVFLIQHTQNRDVEIINLKLNELIKAHQDADNHSIDLSKLSDESLKELRKNYEDLCNKQTGI